MHCRNENVKVGPGIIRLNKTKRSMLLCISDAAKCHGNFSDVQNALQVYFLLVAGAKLGEISNHILEWNTVDVTSGSLFEIERGF